MLRRIEKTLEIVLALFLVGLVNTAGARTKVESPGKGFPQPQVAASPFNELRVHNVGKFWLSVTNYGIFGSESGGLVDPCTHQSAPSAEFPGGTGVNYLFQGALWIGAIRGEDTLVTVGADGWELVNEMNAVQPYETRTIRTSGIQQGDCFIPYSPDAVSEQDFIAIMADTCDDPSCVDFDPTDGQFVPESILVTQKSYAWSYDYAQDFVLFDYSIRNIGSKKLSLVYLGVYVDADILNSDEDPTGFQDDVSGFKHSVPSFRCPAQYQDTINIGWVADADGMSNCSICEDRKRGVFVATVSQTSVAGTRVVKAPSQVKTSFNWWNSQTTVSLDWGPWTVESFTRRPDYFGNNIIGTPVGDDNKYFTLSNGEFDYDQLKANLPIWADSGWQPNCPTDLCRDIADGYDTRYLISFGPFNINPGDSIPLTLGYIAGEDFHVRPSDWNIFGEGNNVPAVTKYCDTLLDYADFGTNARWSGWVYDNPGVDTDSLTDLLPPGDPNRKGRFRICDGETVYYEGDGVPDFKGPPPPDPPTLRFETTEGKVIIRWNGKKTETTPDKFSGAPDFEGYRIFLSRSGLSNDYALLDSYDKNDLKMYVYNPGNQKWSLKAASLDSADLVNQFATDNACCYPDIGGCTCLDTLFCQDPNAFGLNPLYWTQQNPYTFKGSCGNELCVTPTICVRIGEDAVGDKVAFDKQDWNQDLMVIKKYKNEIAQGIYTPADSEYYEYEYTIDSLSPSQPVSIAVTAFDYGNPQTGLAPLETSPLVNARQVWPLPSPPEGTLGKKVVVFPNPYKITELYPGENRSLPSGKRIHFVQLPGACTIRIFTLDGDEVVVLKNNDPQNPEMSWNLISRNGQEVVAGVYIYHVESDRGSQVGKFVVVK
jgi:hypothetical protein